MRRATDRVVLSSRKQRLLSKDKAIADGRGWNARRESVCVASANTPTDATCLYVYYDTKYRTHTDSLPVLNPPAST